ncbi:hypothetical protein TGDOM2_399970 [Toxoplasma gondii GAB2-2007-GAL-DOM2]|uniref:Uncharacterized protein n=1 Tax=Toxoplasma gondii GAB2-2007-GAL-DOM2 TaxID=1130820 RepID=A0A086JYH7_TOXGO|nr:hypothetical protein TGDOM2_399970 [Toxoplasma gondii GAB2-2007-GAL-DOM2]
MRRQVLSELARLCEHEWPEINDTVLLSCPGNAGSGSSPRCRHRSDPKSSRPATTAIVPHHVDVRWQTRKLHASQSQAAQTSPLHGPPMKPYGQGLVLLAQSF